MATIDGSEPLDLSSGQVAIHRSRLLATRTIDSAGRVRDAHGPVQANCARNSRDADLVLRPFQFFLSALVPDFVFLGRAERKRRPVDNVSDDQLQVRLLCALGRVFERAVAAFAAIDTDQQNFTHFCLPRVEHE